MKKVLILAYDYPPYISVAGLRPSFWAENFHEFGIYPIIITRSWNVKHGNELDYLEGSESDEIITDQNEFRTILRTPYFPTLSNRLNLKGRNGKIVNFAKKLNTAFFEFFQFYIPIGTKYQLYKAAEKFLVNNEVDCIIATGEPFILFKYASNLSKKFKIPWIADYRDPWSSTNVVKNKIQNKYEFFLEKKFVKSAQILTTVNPNFEMLLYKLFPQKRIEIVANGYDDIDTNHISVQVDQNFLISYAGTIYNWHPVEIFLEAFADWKTTNNIENAYVQFIGSNISTDLLEKYKLHVMEMPKMDVQLLFAEFKRSSLLLLFNDYFITGTKIYDYLLAKRKILLCFESEPRALKLKEDHLVFENIDSTYSEQSTILNKTQSGIFVKNCIELQQILSLLYIDFQEGKIVDVESRNVDDYSRLNQLKILSEIVAQL